MPRKRVHELAKEYGLDPRDLLAKLEKLGIRGKRAQSSLTDEEVEQIRTELVKEEKPSIAVGDERVTQGTEGQTVVERRVRTNVIRRRTTRTEMPAAETAGADEPLPLHSEAFESFESFALPES